MATMWKTYKRGPHTEGEKIIYECRKRMTDMTEQRLAEEKAEKERPYPDMEEQTPHDLLSATSKTTREKRNGRLEEKIRRPTVEKCTGQLQGSHRDRKTTLRIPYVYRRIQYYRLQRKKTILQEHLVRKKSQWEKKEQWKTVTAKLLAHKIKTRDVTVPPPVVVVSLLIYQWGNPDSEQLTLRIK